MVIHLSLSLSLSLSHTQTMQDKEDNTTMPDPCDMCRDEPTSPVCGPDGRNHLSRCTAIYCAGIPAVELKDGPCQSQVSRMIYLLAKVVLSYVKKENF